jgi:hypothetical protein
VQQCRKETKENKGDQFAIKRNGKIIANVKALNYKAGET